MTVCCCWVLQVDPGEIEGTDLRVLKYPHPALREENEEIEEFTDDVKKLAREMFKVQWIMTKMLSVTAFHDPLEIDLTVTKGTNRGITGPHQPFER